MTVLWLTDPRCQSPELSGNKGSFLARLTVAGYRVPKGFCIPPGALASSAGRKEVFPQRCKFEVREMLEQLPGPWVVRSSSTAEDSKNLSFAGVFKTVLGLTTSDEVIEAIHTVVDSKDLEISQRYAKHHGIVQDDIGMAVIVQTLVNASCSGVAFSRHPVTNERKLVIEANYGLGDTLVDGSVSPDLIEVTEDGHVNVVRIGSKKIKSVFVSDHLARVDTPDNDRKRLALSQEAARNLAAVVRRIEADFGEPQDVEWAMTFDILYVLQARPITTLKKDA